MADIQTAVERAREYIGREWGPAELLIEPCWVRTFVEAIEDPNPLWLDEGFARGTPWGGTILPPTAVCSLQSRFRIRLHPAVELDWGTGSVNAGIQYQLFEPIRPADRITCRCRIAAVYHKMGRRGPLIFVIREQTLENQRGEPVMTGRQTSAYYQGSRMAAKRPIPDPVRPDRRPNAGEAPFLEELALRLRRDPGMGPAFEEVKIGQELPSVSCTTSARHQVKWLASTEDWEEIHYDYVYCRQVGLPDVICNGNFGYCRTAGRMLTDWLGTTGKLTGFSINYLAPAYVGDVITAKGTVSAKSRSEDRTVEVETRVENQRGEVTVKGVATVVLRGSHS